LLADHSRIKVSWGHSANAPTLPVAGGGTAVPVATGTGGVTTVVAPKKLKINKALHFKTVEEMNKDYLERLDALLDVENPDYYSLAIQA
jgi:hypothetical protein